MISLPGLNFAAEHVIAPAGVAKNDRNNQQCAHQHKALALRGSGSLPQRDGRRDNMRPDADPQSAKAEKDQAQRQREGRNMAVALMQRAPQPAADEDHQQRHR